MRASWRMIREAGGGVAIEKVQAGRWPWVNCSMCEEPSHKCPHSRVGVGWHGQSCTPPVRQALDRQQANRQSTTRAQLTAAVLDMQ